MNYLASTLPFVGVGIILISIFLTLAEIFTLKFSKRVDSPKFVWFPISANAVALIIIFVTVFLTIVLFFVGFIVSLDAGIDEGEKYFYLMIFLLVLIPILTFAVRTILFLLFKLGKFPIALLYSFVTALVNLVILFVTAYVFLLISDNFLK